ncbi:hypothetical protein BSY15_2470 [Acidovorax sp. RAC01]|nr:hypothetical protein BSY15_2470 [Acidovorax sp. RAC01]
MTFRRTVVRGFLKFTDRWNHEIHQAIEERILESIRRDSPATGEMDLAEREKAIREMRSFYFTRVSATANLLVAAAALVVALVALVVSSIQLFNA